MVGVFLIPLPLLRSDLLAPVQNFPINSSLIMPMNHTAWDESPACLGVRTPIKIASYYAVAVDMQHLHKIGILKFFK